MGEWSNARRDLSLVGVACAVLALIFSASTFFKISGFIDRYESEASQARTAATIDAARIQAMELRIIEISEAQTVYLAHEQSVIAFLVVVHNMLKNPPPLPEWMATPTEEEEENASTRRN